MNTKTRRPTFSEVYMYKNLLWLSVISFVFLPIFSELILRVVYLYTVTDIAYASLAAPINAVREILTVVAKYISLAVLCVAVVYFDKHAVGVVRLAFISHAVEAVTYIIAYFLYTGGILAASLIIIVEAAVNCLVTLIIWLFVRGYARKRETFLNVPDYKLGASMLRHPYTGAFIRAIAVFGGAQLGFVLYDMIDAFLDPSLGTPINMKETVYWILLYAEVIIYAALGFMIAVAIGLLSRRIKSKGKESARLINEANANKNKE